jgi:transposase
MKYTLKAAPSVGARELKNQKSAKATQILVGADVHLRGYQVARKVDNAAIGVVENFRSEEALLLFVEKQCERAERVALVYEAGPLGYTLYRKLKARGVECYVCAPDSTQQKRKRVKTNKIDARSLTSKLFNYLNGDQNALQLARVPSEAQEQLRLASRQHDQLVEERKRLGAKGNAMLLSQGFGSWSNWWRPKAWALLSAQVPAWLLERLKVWVDVLKILDEKICQAKVALARACSGPRPKGVGALSQMQLQGEVLDWSLYPNRRKIACLGGMVPSEWSTGVGERRGSITKVGVSAIRRIITEMVWRMILFQPQYKPVQKWKEVLAGSNPALKKKAVVAIGRQLIVDLWRLQTGRVTAQELNLVIIGA